MLKNVKSIGVLVMVACLAAPTVAFAGSAMNSKDSGKGYNTAILTDQNNLLVKLVAEQHETNVLLKKLLAQEKLTNARFVPFKKPNPIVALRGHDK